MSRIPEQTGSALQRMISAAQGEPKKAGIMVVLGVMLFVLWARTLVSSGEPARAAGSMVRQISSGNESLVVPPEATVAPTVSLRPDPIDQRVREWLAEPPKQISRNLFTVKLDYYPIDASRAGQVLKAGEDGEFWAKLEKSLMLQADQQGRRDNLVANYAAAAGKMRLDSIMMGPQPKAMIDGKLVTEGDVAAGFRVLKIEPRRIVIEREGIRLEIQMK